MRSIISTGKAQPSWFKIKDNEPEGPPEDAVNVKAGSPGTIDAEGGANAATNDNVTEEGNANNEVAGPGAGGEPSPADPSGGLNPALAETLDALTGALDGTSAAAAAKGEGTGTGAGAGAGTAPKDAKDKAATNVGKKRKVHLGLFSPMCNAEGQELTLEEMEQHVIDVMRTQKENAGKPQETTSKTPDDTDDPDSEPSRLTGPWEASETLKTSGLFSASLGPHATRILEFFHVPISANDINFGYCFLNFRTPELAQRFRYLMEGKRLPGNSKKRLLVTPASSPVDSCHGLSTVARVLRKCAWNDSFYFDTQRNVYSCRKLRSAPQLALSTRSTLVLDLTESKATLIGPQRYAALPGNINHNQTNNVNNQNGKGNGGQANSSFNVRSQSSLPEPEFEGSLVDAE